MNTEPPADFTGKVTMKDGLHLFLAGLLLAVAGCGGSDVQEPATGGISITTVSSGPETDPDGYSISIDGGAASAIAINATMQRDNLEPGSHRVELGGLAPNCAVAGENPRTVGVVSGETATVGFEVTCSATSGSIQVSATTTGSSPDPDGYVVTLDGSDRGPLAAEGTVTFDGLTDGTHLVGLTGVAANCAVEGENPRLVVVSAGASASAAFSVACSEPTPGAGGIRVTTATTGAEPDPDGYTFALDGGAGQPIGASATATLANVPPGLHRVRLTGAAANCMIQGTNPRPVTVASGAIAEVSFALACIASTGGLTISTATTGSTPDSDGYSVTVDGGTEQVIGPNATITLPGLAAGSHAVVLGNVATNCSVAGRNPRTISIVAGRVATTMFNVTCVVPLITHWTRMESGTTNDLINISGSSAANIFVVDREGQIRHYDGISWTVQSAPLTVNHIWAGSPGNAFATGTQSEGIPPILRSVDGGVWFLEFSTQAIAPPRLEHMEFVWNAIGGSGNDVYALGGWKAASDDTLPLPGLIAHFVDGFTWSAELWDWPPEFARTGKLTDIWGSADGDIYMTTTEDWGDPVGSVWHKLVFDWELVHRDGPASFDHISGASGSDIYVTANPTERFVDSFWHFDGTTWNGDRFNDYGPVTDIWASSTAGVFVLASGNVYRGDTLVYRNRTGSDLNDIWGSSATDIYVVGDAGTILHGTP